MLQNKVPTRLPAAPSATDVCAVVVAYFPDEDFTTRLQAILPQVARLVVVDNTPGVISLSPSIVAAWEERLYHIANQSNKGVATALNQGLEYALRQGYRWILTLDQDTQCYPDMVDTLLRVSETCPMKPVIVGGNYLDPRNKESFVPIGEAEDFLGQITVITSGCLVDAGVASATGGFREDYFIDQVDHEFCLRMRVRGHKAVISRKPVMSHSVGMPGGARLPLLGVLPNHPPLRKYYIARNTVVTIMGYWRQEPMWCLRRSVRLLLGLFLMATLEKQRLTKVRAFSAGFVDGIRRHMGPCGRAWLLRPTKNP